MALLWWIAADYTGLCVLLFVVIVWCLGLLLRVCCLLCLLGYFMYVLLFGYTAIDFDMLFEP